MTGDRGTGQESGLFRFLFVETTLAWLLAALLVLGGAMAYRTIAKEATPDLGVPRATVTTVWPGAGPLLVEDRVTDVLEEHLQELKNLKRYESGSRTGHATISVTFHADAPVKESIQALRARVWEALGELPAGARRPDVEAISGTDAPVMSVALTGNVPDGELAATARRLDERMARLPGIRRVARQGGEGPVVEVLVDPHKQAGANLTLASIREAITQGTADHPLGRVVGDPVNARLTLQGRFTAVHDLRHLPVRGPGGQTHELGTVATVAKGRAVPDSHVATSLDGKPLAPAALLHLYKVPGADTLRVTRAARDLLDGARLPDGVTARVTSNRAHVVERKLNEVFRNAAQAVVAVVAVLVLFLSWRAAVIAGLAVPVTFLGALMLIQAVGLSLNVLVIVGMVLALGLMVDVFILVMEGMIQGRREHGLAFPEAAAWTVRTFALPAFAGQITTILALTPLLFLGGISGKFIKLIPLTAIICLLLSYGVAFLWAIPASRRLLQSDRAVAGGSLLDRPMLAASRVLRRFLERAVTARRWQAAAWVLAGGVLVAGALALGSGLNLKMSPPQDVRHMAATAHLGADTTLRESRAVGRRLGNALRDAPWLESVMVHAGRASPYAYSGPGARTTRKPGPGVVGLSLNFTTLAQRDGRLAYTYADTVRQRLKSVLEDRPGARLSITKRTGGPGPGGSGLVLQSENLEKLRAAARDLKARLAKLPGVVAVSDSMGRPRQDLRVTPRRTALAAHGVPLNRLADALSLAMERTTVARMSQPGRESTPVVMAVDWGGDGRATGHPRGLGDLEILRLPDHQGRRVPVADLVTITPKAVPRVIPHKGRTRTVTVNAEVAGGDSTSNFAAKARQARQAVLKKHPGVHAAQSQSSAQQQRTVRNMQQMFLVALVLMVATLVLLFRSYRLALIILGTIPLALVGTLGGFAAIGMPLSFPAMVGMVSLLGIVVNVAIIMVDTITRHRDAGSDAATAAAAGVAERLRPLASTVLTTVAGLVLLSTASPMWQPLCYAIIFGLVAATLLSLVVIPALYRLMAPAAAGRT